MSIAMDHAGGGGSSSEPMTLAADQPHTLVVASKAFARGIVPARPGIRIYLDEKLVIERPYDSAAPGTNAVMYGVNAVESGACQIMFSGSILEVKATTEEK